MPWPSSATYARHMPRTFAEHAVLFPAPLTSTAQYSCAPHFFLPCSSRRFLRWCVTRFLSVQNTHRAVQHRAARCRAELWVEGFSLRPTSYPPRPAILIAKKLSESRLTLLSSAFVPVLIAKKSRFLEMHFGPTLFPPPAPPQAPVPGGPPRPLLLTGHESQACPPDSWRVTNLESRPF